jgi:small subunit ribosomal protein S16
MEPSLIELDEEKVLKWLREGAQPTSQVRKLMQIKGIWQKYQEEKSGK